MRRKSESPYLSPYELGNQNKVREWKRMGWLVYVLQFREGGRAVYPMMWNYKGRWLTGTTKTAKRTQWMKHALPRLTFYLAIQRACRESLVQAVEEISTLKDAKLDPALFVELYS